MVRQACTSQVIQSFSLLPLLQLPVLDYQSLFSALPSDCFSYITTCALPCQFHLLICYRKLLFFAGFTFPVEEYYLEDCFRLTGQLIGRGSPYALPREAFLARKKEILEASKTGDGRIDVDMALAQGYTGKEGGGFLRARGRGGKGGGKGWRKVKPGGRTGWEH
eukprot:748909-Hanusia_phi.AAC.4